MKKLFCLLFVFLCTYAVGQETVVIAVHPSQGEQKISRHIYGQFAEHLGTGIYGGLWVGEDSSIPNTNGYRTDVLEALKRLNIPNLRWPGGCFADEYHWKDGIGPRADRPKMSNNNWGGLIEDNSFGTHEFLNLCEILGCEPYVSLNLGSGSVEEMAEWIEYMTSDGDTPMARLRRENGREKPWNVHFVGIGNESWGCGGNMKPDYYVDLYRRYTTFCRNYDGNRLYKIASGPGWIDPEWTETLMKEIGSKMNAMSLHYYTVTGWQGKKGSATDFDAEDYYWTIGKCLDIENTITATTDIMDKYDPKKRVGLMVDEWGTWWEPEPGTQLHQQNTMRDAFVAALSLNVFHRHIDRIRMTNIAQMVNVLQSMILTEGEKMVITPTYYVFEMYKPHQDALFLPIEMQAPTRTVREERTIPLVDATASRDDEGKIHISLANIDLDNPYKVRITLDDTSVNQISGTMLTSKKIDDCNTFEKPNKVKPVPFKGAKWVKDAIELTLPAHSIVTLEVE
ncbi:MAG: alpha-N-arabinofuranosidase [Porphyromonadaceae bacterium]|nr:alpha-N-arabinofuranosidase [Porphyromonadaceae bacterium]